MIGNPNKRLLIADYDQKISAYSNAASGTWGQGDQNTLLFEGLAKITIFDGSKALEYREQGLNNPVRIETNWLDVVPDYIEWEGKKIVNISFVDPDNHFKRRVIMLGSFTQ